MSVHAVNEILRAEEEARRIKEAGVLKVKEISAEAEKKCDAWLLEAQNDAEAKAKLIKEASLKKIADIAHACDSESQKLADALKSGAEAKIPQAVKYIIENII